MFKKYLDKLEFNSITNTLLKYSNTFVGQRIINGLEPYSDTERVRRYLAETTEAVNLIHSFGALPISHFDDLSVDLRSIYNLFNISKKTISNIKGNLFWSFFYNICMIPIASGLLEFANILKTSHDLKDFYSNSGIICENLQCYFDSLYQNDVIQKKIYSSLVSEDEVSDNASAKLTSIRKSKKNLILEIRNRLNSIIHSNTYSKYLMESVITIRNDRFVIPVKDEYKNQVKGFIHDVSASGSTVYIEPMAVFEMNNAINSLSVEEDREIERILEELSSLFYPISSFINQNVNLIGKLDFINAKAK